MTKAVETSNYFIHGFSTIFYQQFFQLVLLFTWDLLLDFSLLPFGELLHLLNGDLKNQIRNFEKQKMQILSAKYGIHFNQTHIYIYIYVGVCMCV